MGYELLYTFNGWYKIVLRSPRLTMRLVRWCKSKYQERNQPHAKTANAKVSPFKPQRRKDWSQLGKRTGLSILAFIATMAHRQIVAGGLAGISMQVQHNPVAFTEGLTSWLSILYIQFRYVWLLVWPYELSVDYSMDCVPLVHQLSDPRNLCSLALYVGLC